MSEHLKDARKWLDQAEPGLTQRPGRTEWYQQRALWRILSHLEAQQETPAHHHETSYKWVMTGPAIQETPASEPSSAPTIGPAIKRYGSAIANLDTRWGSYLLTVETGGSFKSISCTSDEWAAIRQFFLTPQQIRESLTPSGETKDGDRGPAVPDPSPESAAQPGREETRPNYALGKRMVELYLQNKPRVAEVFDKHLDPSGLSLGMLRDAASSPHLTNQEGAPDGR